MSARLPRMATAAALVGALAVAVAAQSEPPVGPPTAPPAAEALEPSQLDDPWSAVAPKIPPPESRTLQRRSTKSALPLLTGASDKAERPWLRTLGPLAGVVGLIVLLAWGYRAVAGRNLPLLSKARRPGLIEVVSKTALSARQTLYLVRIGPRLVLVGQSPEALRALDVIDDADLAARLTGEAARKRPDSSEAEFRAWLEREAQSYQAGGDGADETVAPEPQRLAEVQQSMTKTIRRVQRVVAQA